MKMKKIASLMMIGVAALGVLSNNVYAENKDAELISDSAYQESYSKIWGQIDAIDESGRLLVSNSSNVNNEVLLNITEDTIIIDAVTGTPLQKNDVKTSETIYAYVGRAMTMSLPPITNAKVIIANIAQDAGVPSYIKVESIKKNDNGTVTLITDGGKKEILIDNETSIFPYRTRNIVTVEDIKQGSELLVWEEYNKDGIQTKEFPIRVSASKCMIMPEDVSNNIHTDVKPGWFKENDIWYYINIDGEKHTGWLKDNDKWYYLNSDGAMKTGWLLDNNEYYYLKDNGEMAHNEYIDGYYLQENGAWAK